MTMVALNRQLTDKGCVHLMEPLFWVNLFTSLLVGAEALKWDEEKVIALLCKSLNEDIDEDIKARIRPWAKRQRPDLELLKEYARSWKDTTNREVSGFTARVSEGLNRKGCPSKRPN
jgi:hypothetical protein